MVRESATRPVGDPDMADETLLVNPEDGHVWTDDDIDSVKLCLEEDAEEGGFEDDLAECGTVDEVIGVMEENRVVWSRSGNAEVCYLERYWRLSDETGRSSPWRIAKSTSSRTGTTIRRTPTHTP